MTFANPGSPPSRPLPGIFKFEGDRLIIMLNGERGRLPDSFEAKCATKFVLRKAPAKPAKEAWHLLIQGKLVAVHVELTQPPVLPRVSYRSMRRW
jgi:hypothetical protein